MDLTRGEKVGYEESERAVACSLFLLYEKIKQTH